MGKILEAVLDEFKNLAAIPRPSKHEEKVSNFLRDYLKSYGFEVVQDEDKNIIAEIPAGCGKEGKRPAHDFTGAHGYGLRG